MINRPAPAKSMSSLMPLPVFGSAPWLVDAAEVVVPVLVEEDELGADTKAGAVVVDAGLDGAGAVLDGGPTEGLGVVVVVGGEGGVLVGGAVVQPQWVGGAVVVGGVVVGGAGGVLVGGAVVQPQWVGGTVVVGGAGEWVQPQWLGDTPELWGSAD